jgi:hypothetical protein
MNRGRDDGRRRVLDNDRTPAAIAVHRGIIRPESAGRSRDFKINCRAFNPSKLPPSSNPFLAPEFGPYVVG